VSLNTPAQPVARTPTPASRYRAYGEEPLPQVRRQSK